ncbi:hypothetical protein [Anaeromyxobacter oryzisoli]|uniref:hypothetical protein n=1 Tax=Anaeromyxobacter oryzisoli TaxID=2925408 RepID=UPI001F57ECD2|nr:hypothetical protein [Anaeromyxobacter sp. SG63]
MNKIVWILGAGFSKPLGGPLLTELLSPGSMDILQAAFGSHSWVNHPSIAATVDLYRAHL